MSQPLNTSRQAPRQKPGRQRTGPLDRPPALPRPAQAKWSSAVNVVAGLWLVISPWAFDYSAATAMVVNAVVTGAAIAVLALVRVAVAPRLEALSWLNLVLGAWLVASPFVLGQPQVADGRTLTLNNVLVGWLVLSYAGVSIALTAHSRRAR